MKAKKKKVVSKPCYDIGGDIELEQINVMDKGRGRVQQTPMQPIQTQMQMPRYQPVALPAVNFDGQDEDYSVYNEPIGPPEDPNVYKPQVTAQPAKKAKTFKAGTSFNIDTTDITSGIVAGINGLLPYQKPKSNQQYLQQGPMINSSGTGSHASFENGGSLEAISNEDRLAWEKMQGEAYRQGYVGNDHSKLPGKEFMQQHGVDPNRLQAYQQDFQSLSQTDPGRIGYKNELSKVDDIYGHRTSQQRYKTYSYENQHFNNRTGQYETYQKRNTGTQPLASAQVQDLSSELIPVAPVEQLPVKQARSLAKAAPANTGFLTREEAVAKYKAKKNSTVAANMEYGGQVPLMNGQGLQVEEDQYEHLSPGMINLKGASHENGGIDIAYNGTQIEAEGQEPIAIDSEGNAVVFGNLHIPGTTTKFKTAAKDLGRMENKAEKIKDKSAHFLNSFDDKIKYQAPSFNTGKVLSDAYQQKQRQNEELKEYLSTAQDKMLELAEYTGTDPEKLSSMMKGKAKFGKKLPMVKDGDSLRGDTRQKSIRLTVDNAAAKYDIDPVVLHKLITTESGYNPKAVSNKGARGVMQFMEPTAKAYGISKQQLNSDDPGDIQAVIDAGAHHISDLLKTYKGDYKLALAAYNGGPDAVNFAKNLSGNKNISGNDWVDIIGKRRKDAPTDKQSAWQNQTYDYVTGIMGDRAPVKFRQEYGYNVDMTGEEDTTPDPPALTVPRPDPNTELTELNQQYPSTPFEPLTPDNSGIFSNDKTIVPVQNHLNLTPNTKKGKGLRNKAHLADYLGEISTLLDSPEPVPSIQVNPILEPEYNISLQAKKNAIIGAYKPAMEAARNHPAQQTAIAGQMAEQLASIDGEEFSYNQQNTGAIRARNLQELRGVRDMNTQLTADQMNKQVAARSITQDNKFRAATSISQKEAARRAQNNQLQIYEQLKGWSVDANNNATMLHAGNAWDDKLVPIYNPMNDTKSTITKKYKRNGQETIIKEEEKYFGGKITKRKKK